MSEVIYDAKAIREILKSNNIRYSKSMGQNFLIDAAIPEKLVRLSGVDRSCGVLEVGPGLGALTLELSRSVRHVVAVELDGRLLPVLRKTLADTSNVEVIHGDILKLDIAELVYAKLPDIMRHVCANLPYNITTPILTAFIQAKAFKTITVMVQREVARRICATPGSPDYGAFTVYINYHSEPETLFDIPPECFVPRPEVYSSVIKLKIRSELPLMPEDEAAFFRVVRAAFGQRRKTLVNALHSVYGNTMQKKDIEEIVGKCGLDSHIRGEVLGIEEFMRLSAFFKQKADY